MRALSAVRSGAAPSVVALVAAASVAAGVAACASPGGGPPGGPEDATPPRLVSVTPESGSAGVSVDEVVFRFDEVVSETPRVSNGGGGSLGGPTLDQLVIVSPRDGAPRVSWGRSRIEVRPRRGFRDNTTYTVTLLPGVSDLRNNARDTGAVTFFSTGGPVARARITGTVFDWVAGRAAPRAWVEALTPDSTRYVAVADSNGRFVIDHVPAGRYLVSGGIDANNNRTLDPREAFDSARATATETAPRDTGGVELLAFVHDTVAPRIQTVTAVDSVTLRVAFDKPLDPGWTPRPEAFQVVAPDSSRVPIRAAVSGPAFDSAAARRARAAADSAARADSVRADTARRAAPPPAAPVRRPPGDTARADTTRPAARPSRPSPSPDVVLTLGAMLRPGTSYRVDVRDARSLTGVAGPSVRSITIERRRETRDTVPPAPRDTTRRAPRDTIPRTPRDTSAPARPGTPPARPAPPPARPDTVVPARPPRPSFTPA